MARMRTRGVYSDLSCLLPFCPLPCSSAMVASSSSRTAPTRGRRRVDPAWLAPGATRDRLGRPGIAERRGAASCSPRRFDFHELAVEDAIAGNRIIPKIEPYDGMLYLILHGIVGRQEAPGVRDPRRRFLSRRATTWSRCTITRRARSRPSRSVLRRHARCSAKGPCSLLHRHRRSDGRPLRPGGRRARGAARDARAEGVQPVRRSNPLRDILGLKRGHRVAPARRRCRSVTPSAGSRGASSRRSPSTLSYRFRDVYDHLVRLADEAVFLQDRVTGLLDAHCRRSRIA